MVATPKAAAGGATVGALIERIATERPQAIFLLEPESGRTTTFAELRQQVAELVARLERLDLVRRDRVGIAMENGAQAVVSHLAAMSGGFVPVPLDPGAGPSQLAQIVRHCEPRAIAFTAARRAQIEPLLEQVDAPIARIEVDASADLASGPPPQSATRCGPDDVLPDDDALLMYTSGSTGHPKGVLVSHAGLIARAAERARAHEIGPDDRLLGVLPLHHMNAQNTMLGVLHSGGSIVVPAGFSVAQYWDWVVAYRCTWLSVVPTIIAQLLRRGETQSGSPPGDLSHVRFARCSSAPLSDAAHRAFEERFGILLVQGMGMSEAGGIFVNPPHRSLRKIGSLGRPCGLDAKLVGADGRELGRGQTGELLVRGPGVMRAYFRDKEATANAIDARGWLRTGDLVQRDEDGYFFHAGRAKELIIKAGTNVAPGEIDAALASHPAVVQAAAIGIPDTDLGEEIAAFVVLRQGARCTERDLLGHCEARLGEFKTPSWIRFVDSLPTGPTGKVQRARLSARAAAESHSAGGGVPLPSARGNAFAGPRTAVERAVAAAWEDVLGRENLGIDDDFFALGGSSLMALRITTHLRRSLGVQLSLGVLLGAPTVAAQAEVIEERLRRAAAGDAPDGDTAEGAAATLLAPVEQSGAALPLFCVHDIARFRRLAQTLGARQPVFGVAVGPAIRAIDSTASTATFKGYSVEELARVCVPEIRRIQPAGPYQIAGFSFGGRIALEVAQQLRSAGEEVRLLVILDTFMPGAFRRRPLSRVALHLAELRRLGPRYLVAAARRRWAGSSLDRGPEPEPDETAPGELMDQRYAEFRLSLRIRYRPRPFAGTVVLFRATVRDDVSPQFRVDPLLGWGDIARDDLRTHDVPGAHLEILDEYGTPIVAEALRGYLNAPRSTRG